MAAVARVLCILGLVVAIGCALAALGAGLGYRFGWWHYSAGIATLGNVFWVAVGTAAFCALALVFALVAARPSPMVPAALAAAGLAVAGVTAWIPYDLRMTANALPRIHDISTDLADPPAFVRAAELRVKGEHPVAYDGPEVAAMQRKAYPDLVTLELKAPRDKVLLAASAALVSMGLEITASDMAAGRIEAVATSRLFGFKDDVVVRVRSAESGSRVDVRSKSRVGRHDFGANAKRIRAFRERLSAAMR